MSPLLLLLLASCFGGKADEDKWSEQYASALCDFQKRCMTALYWSEFDDSDECLDDYEDDLDDLEDLLDDCDFDDSEAQDCLDGLSASCKTAGEDLEDVLEACGAVWDCGDGYSYGYGSSYY